MTRLKLGEWNGLDPRRAWLDDGVTQSIHAADTAHEEEERPGYGAW